MARFPKRELRMGDTATDFTLLTVDGSSLSLSEIARTKRGVLLVFLRHLG